MKRVVAVALGFALSACAIDGGVTGPTGQDFTYAVGDRFVGKPIHNMLARYGAPYLQQVIAGETVMSWERYQTANWSTGPETYRCQLDAYVLPDGNVRTIGFSGKLGGCDSFMP